MGPTNGAKVQKKTRTPFTIYSLKQYVDYERKAERLKGRSLIISQKNLVDFI